jgi:hypothetical protein
MGEWQGRVVELRQGCSTQLHMHAQLNLSPGVCSTHAQ